MPTKIVFNEIATTRDGRDITRGYLLPDMPLEPQDSVLLEQGRGYDIYKELLRDDQVKTGIDQRINALVGCEIQVDAGGTRRADKKAADFIREMLDGLGSTADDPQFTRAGGLSGFDSLTQKMWYAIYYGFGVAEFLYARDGGNIILDAVKVRDRRRFQFDGEGRLRLMTSTNPVGELLPPRKFWVLSYGADHDDEPYGLGLGHWLYWPVYFKKNILKFGLIHLEKFASPTVTGEYPAELDRDDSPAGLERATETKAKLLAAVQAVQLDSGIVFPEGMKVGLLEASRSGTADYQGFFDTMQGMIAKIILGQTASSEGTAGKLGNENLRGQVKGEYLKSDADMICGSFNNSIVRWLCEWNFPGAAIPRVWRMVDSGEDLDARAERDGKIFAFSGTKPSAEYLEQVYGEEYRLTAEQSVEPVAPVEPVGDALADAPAFAEKKEEGGVTRRSWSSSAKSQNRP